MLVTPLSMRAAKCLNTRESRPARKNSANNKTLTFNTIYYNEELSIKLIIDKLGNTTIILNKEFM